MFDQSRKSELSSYGESVRLSNELRDRTARTIRMDKVPFTIPARLGFNCETATYERFNVWLNNPSIRKSESLFWFVIRIMAWRFPTQHSTIRANLSAKHRLEYDLILSQMKNEVEWVGQVGYQNFVRLDGSLDKKGIRGVLNR